MLLYGIRQPITAYRIERVAQMARVDIKEERSKSAHSEISVLKERCKGCRFCIEFCSRQVLYESLETNDKGYHIVDTDSNKDCHRCGICEMICPEFAIFIIPLEE